MNIEELLVYGKKYCHSDIVKIILADTISLNPLELLNHLNDVVDQETVDIYKKKIEAVYNNIPVQYALGKVNFYGNEYIVNKNVLIPRFETEQLVEQAIIYINELFDYPVKVIDLGCGSGVIGLTLEQKINIKSLDLIDISSKALEVAKINATKFNSKANIIESDMFHNISDKYDVIISNPPYIKEDEEIEEIVKNNEPAIALYGGKDGLTYYEQILKDVTKYMNDRCLIAFEIGYMQKEDIINLVNKYLPDVKIIAKKDLSDRDRMLFIIK